MQLDLFNPTISDLSARGEPLLRNRQSDLLRINGLRYLPNFISREEHDELILTINNQSWLNDLRRRVQHYGWKYDYKAKSIDYSMFLGELPIWAKRIARKIYDEKLTNNEPDQLIINEYYPGQGIANHIDCEPCFGNTILSLSLGAPCVMDLIDTRNKEKIELLLEPRSLVLIGGEARYKWTHGIPARKSDTFHGVRFERDIRISLTFREVILK